MTSQLDLGHSQLEELDKEALISIILVFQQQVQELQRTVVICCSSLNTTSKAGQKR
jgi:hypothetical protein